MSDKRRYPRIHFKNYSEADKIEKAFLHWRNHERSEVFDLSLGGLAVSRPALAEFELHDVQEFALELGERGLAQVSGKVVWLRDFTLGLEFQRLNPDGHLALRKFLNERLVGTYLRLMNKDLYSKTESYDQWYAGPAETHFLIRLENPSDRNSPVKSAEILLDGDRFLYSKGSDAFNAEIRSKLIHVLSHAHEDCFSLKNLLNDLREQM